MVRMYNHNRVLYEKPLAVLARDLEELWANEPESVDPWLPTGTARPSACKTKSDRKDGKGWLASMLVKERHC